MSKLNLNVDSLIENNNKQELEAAVKYYSDLYYNDVIEHPEQISDFDFDRLEKSLIDNFPIEFESDDNIKVGSDVRGSKIKLPTTVGSLDRLYDQEYLTSWITESELSEAEAVCSDKLDGMSGLLSYNPTTYELSISYSRGNGTEGADNTRHSKRISSVPNVLDSSVFEFESLISSKDKPILIRGEFEISAENFTKMRKIQLDLKQKQYVNPRNAVSGLMNSTTIDLELIGLIDFIAYDIDRSALSKTAQFELLRLLGFNIPGFTVVPFKDLTYSKLEDLTRQSKLDSPYALDGIVCDINNGDIRYNMLMASSRKLNPPCSRKIKLKDKVYQATVETIEWKLSKNSVINPTVIIKPCKLDDGVTVRRANGKNAKFILSNQIGPGSIVEIVRAGEVVPDIVGIITTSENMLLPDPDAFGEYDLNETGVQYELLEKGTDLAVKKQIIFFFSHNSIDRLGESTVEKLYANGYDSIAKIINMTEQQLIDLVGVNGMVIHASISKKLMNITEFQLAGSTSFFGTGIGVRKMEQLYDEHKTVNNLSLEQIVSTAQFDIKSGQRVFDGYEQYNRFLDEIENKYKFVEPTVVGSGPLNDTGWAFTKVRDHRLEMLITTLGGVIHNGIKKATTHLVVKDHSVSSNKIKKAKENGVKILDPEEASELLENLRENK